MPIALVSLQGSGCHTPHPSTSERRIVGKKLRDAQPWCEQFVLLLHTSSTQTPEHRAQTPKPDPRAQSWNPSPGAQGQGPEPGAHEPGPQGGPRTSLPSSTANPTCSAVRTGTRRPSHTHPLPLLLHAAARQALSFSPADIHIRLDSHHAHRMGGLLQAQPHGPLRGHPAP